MNELQRIRETQAKLRDRAERQNIERLRRNVDTAKAELSEALLQRENRIMED
jgi:hypothetical protein